MIYIIGAAIGRPYSILSEILHFWSSPKCFTYTLLFFCYPADEHSSCLMTVDDLFKDSDLRERIMIFRLPDYDI